MFEQAEAFQRLIGEFHLTQEEAARRVSMSQSAIANKLRLLRLLPDERARIVESGLTERHARALLKLPDPALRGDVLQHILDRKLNVSASEAYIDRLLTEISRYERQSSASHAGFGTKALSESPFLPDLPQNLAVLGPNDATVKEQPMDEPLAPSDDELPLAIRSVMARRDNRFKGSIKDLRLFYNSIQNAVNILESTGIAANIERTESEQHVCVTITLSKAASGEK